MSTATDTTYSVQVDRKHLVTIDEAARAAYPLETGGILIGWWEGFDSDTIVIHAVAEVVDPEATPTSWGHNQERSQAVLDRVKAELGHPWAGYVGNWHTHPLPVGPSTLDLETLSEQSTAGGPYAMFVHMEGGTFDVRVGKDGVLTEVELEVSE